jgi:hypothetical protein
VVQIKRPILNKKAVEATKQKEEKRKNPKPEEQEGMSQHQHCTAGGLYSYMCRFRIYDTFECALACFVFQLDGLGSLFFSDRAVNESNKYKSCVRAISINRDPFDGP